LVCGGEGWIKSRYIRTVNIRMSRFMSRFKKSRFFARNLRRESQRVFLGSILVDRVATGIITPRSNRMSRFLAKNFRKIRVRSIFLTFLHVVFTEEVKYTV